MSNGTATVGRFVVNFLWLWVGLTGFVPIQIFMFECKSSVQHICFRSIRLTPPSLLFDAGHSVVREALLDRMQKLEVSQARVVDVSDPEAHNVKAQCLKNIQRIHMIAER